MAGRALAGAIWGLVVGGCGVVAASVIAPQPAGNTPPAAPQVAAPVTEPVTLADDTPPADPVLIIEDTAVASAPQVAVPTAEMAAPVTETTPLDLPETLTQSDTLQAPDPGTAPELTTNDVAPVLPNPQSAAPQVPANEGDLIIATEPPEPIVVEEAPVVETEDVIVVTEADTQSVAEDAMEPVLIPQDTAAVQVADTPPVAQTAEIALVEVPETAETVQPTDTADTATPDAQDPTAAETAAPVGAEDGVASAPDVLAEVAESEVSTPRVAETSVSETPVAPEAPTIVDEAPTVIVDTTPQADVVAGSDVTPTEPAPETTPPSDPPVVVSLIDRPAPNLPSGGGGVKVNRSIGSSSAEDADAQTAEPETSIDPDAPALERFAAAFDNPEGKPLMSVILLDDPDFVEGPRAVAEIPFPVTVVLDPTLSGIADRMAEYRALGVEVAVAARLPEGAQASDAAIAFEAAFASLPDTVALIDAGDGNIQGNSDVTGMALSALAEDGRGFVSVSRGLNSGLRAAQTAGVPAALIYDDLDENGQDARVIRRFLDQAAFRARQESGVILLGRMRADTLSALILWGTANRAEQVALAPVSAVLNARIDAP